MRNNHDGTAVTVGIVWQAAAAKIASQKKTEKRREHKREQVKFREWQLDLQAELRGEKLTFANTHLLTVELRQDQGLLPAGISLLLPITPTYAILRRKGWAGPGGTPQLEILPEQMASVGLAQVFVEEEFESEALCF